MAEHLGWLVGRIEFPSPAAPGIKPVLMLPCSLRSDCPGMLIWIRWDDQEQHCRPPEIVRRALRAGHTVHGWGMTALLSGKIDQVLRGRKDGLRDQEGQFSPVPAEERST